LLYRVSVTMSERKDGRLMSGLRAAASAVKKSPQMARKKIGKAYNSVKGKKKVGRSKQYSELDDCQDNGWLHPDDQVLVGVNYKLKYLGSMEINYIPGDPHKNNELAINVMRKVKAMKVSHPNLILTISAGRMTLTRGETHEVIMRHSTSRVAYSTVDHEHPTTFCYVALPRNSKISLCHVFSTKSAKMSYEMTFTCAQAFDVNFRTWQQNKDAAVMKAVASESGDVEPAKAVRSPEVRRRIMAEEDATRARASSLSRSESAGQAASSAPAKDPDMAAVTQGVNDVAVEEEEEDDDCGYIQIEGLEIEDEEDIVRSADEYFSKLSAAHSEPNLLDIGVEPDQYNEADPVDDDDEADE